MQIASRGLGALLLNDISEMGFGDLFFFSSSGNGEDKFEGN